MSRSRDRRGSGRSSRATRLSHPALAGQQLHVGDERPRVQSGSRCCRRCVRARAACRLRPRAAEKLRTHPNRSSKSVRYEVLVPQDASAAL